MTDLTPERLAELERLARASAIKGGCHRAEFRVACSPDVALALVEAARSRDQWKGRAEASWQREDQSGCELIRLIGERDAALAELAALRERVWADFMAAAPSLNMELRPDGSSDPAAAAYVEGWHDAWTALRAALADPVAEQS